MRKIFITLLLLIATLVACGQNTFKYIINANGGIAITAPLSIGGITINSTGAELNILHDVPVSVTAVKLGYLGNLTSDIQTQLNSKQATLVSGTNIKSVGGVSLLGAGDIAVVGTGTVTSVAVTTAGGVSGTVATATTTPAITVTLGAITPTSVAATGTVTGSNLSGTNTGDNSANTLYSGLVTNATHTGDVTGSGALTIATGAVTLAKMANMATGSLIYRKTALAGAPEVNSLATLKTDLGLVGSNTGDQTDISGNAGTATKLYATKTINGVAFDGSANISVPSNITPGTSGNLMISNGTLWTSGTKASQGIITASDTATMLSKYPRALNSSLTGVPTAPTAAPSTNTTQLATTAFVTTADNLKLNKTDTTAMLLKYLRKYPLDSLGLVGTEYAGFLNGDTVNHYIPVAGRIDLYAALDTSEVIETDYRSDLIRADLADYVVGIAASDSANGSGAAGKWVTGKDYNTDMALKANIDNPTFTTGAAGVTQAVGTNSTQLATTAFVFANTETNLLAYNAMGSTIKSFPVGYTLTNQGSSMALADERLVFVATYLSTPQTITGVKLVMNLAGDYVANNYNGVGLYSVSGGTLTLRASSTTNGNLWKATVNTVVTQAFSSTYAAPAGLYYIAFVWSTSDGSPAVVPKIYAGAATAAICASFDFTNNLFLVGYIASKTALPTPTIEASTITPYAALPFASLY
jgi:hypothetical protein